MKLRHLLCSVGRFVLWAILLVGAATILLAATVGWWGPGVAAWLEQPADIRSADAVVVHGGGARRTAYGIQLYQQGFAPELWHTGFAVTEARITTSILGRGVPATAFHWLSTDSTWTDGQAIAAYARERNFQRLLIVTDWWHSRRAVCSVRIHLTATPIELAFAAPPNRGFTANNWWQSAQGRAAVLSELAKFAFYTVRYGLPFWRC